MYSYSVNYINNYFFYFALISLNFLLSLAGREEGPISTYIICTGPIYTDPTCTYIICTYVIYPM